jgi:hypothetical protein
LQLAPRGRTLENVVGELSLIQSTVVFGDPPMDKQPNREKPSGADNASGGRAEDGVPRISGIAYDSDPGVTTYTYSYDPEPPLYKFEHLEEKRLFAITGSDRRTEYFRDRPVRYLVVEPDRETGEFAPVAKRQRPVFLWLCREEREVM